MFSALLSNTDMHLLAADATRLVSLSQSTGLLPMAGLSCLALPQGRDQNGDSSPLSREPALSLSTSLLHTHPYDKAGGWWTLALVPILQQPVFIQSLPSLADIHEDIGILPSSLLYNHSLL